MKRDNSAHFKQSTMVPWIELRIANHSSACYQAHSHDEFSFGLIQHGRAQYHNHHHRHHIGKGDLVTINPADVHACNPEAGLWSYSMLFVDAEQMGRVQQEISDNHRHDYLPFRAAFERDPELKHRFVCLLHDVQSDASQMQIETRLYDFIAATFGDTNQAFRQMPTPDIQRVREKLLDDVSSVHQLDQLAEEAQLSRYQLLRAFKQYYGLPPHAYLMDEKIKRAKVMLKSGEGIVDIAHALGFADQAHFQRQFKRKIAVTPKYYQSHFVES
ncbi:helix-turn-helix transcriptional regulator [Vibrio sinaloensis]|uniref:helix-turn-helix transcriptional regulator n=1 Tax=Photobacterium sp. (strain ATCC 43367) TaxID=379097 RepID=UPI00206F150E|nr:AraC family transcriptional regulator [Vibrio sinaloensis]UPQ89493.1 AraC family transcriptional regulator [Vibrio sinaloensis]